MKLGNVIVLSLMLVTWLSGNAFGCTLVVDAARTAYYGQLDMVRRGLKRETALGFYCEFITNLVAKVMVIQATQPAPLQFGSVCLPNVVLEKMQDSSSGVLRRSIVLEELIKRSTSKIPFLSKAQLDATPHNKSIGNDEWALVEEYINGPIPDMVDVSKLYFPEEKLLRVDPWKTEACLQYEIWSNGSSSSTMLADEYSAIVLSLVMKLSAANANMTGALNLLRHSTAYINVGARCLDLEESELPISTAFLAKYGQQAAYLYENREKNMAVAQLNYTVWDLLHTNTELPKYLSSFHSGGKLPNEVVATDGHLEPLTSNWDMLAGLQGAIEKSKIIIEDPKRYLISCEEQSRTALAAIQANTFDTTFSFFGTGSGSYELSNMTRTKYFGIGGARRMSRSSLDAVARSVLKKVHTLAKSVFSSFAITGKWPEMMQEGDTSLETSVHTTCSIPCDSSNGYVCIEHIVPENNNNLEKCCIDVCQTGADGLSGTALLTFQEGCCAACNEYDCNPSEDDIEAYNIIIPPYSEDDEYTTVIL